MAGQIGALIARRFTYRRKGDGKRIAYYKNAAGKFISKAEFRRLRAGTGQLTERAKENFLRQQLGKPPRGNNWVTIAAKYPDRFADYTEGWT